MGKGKDNKNYNINADHAALEIAKNECEKTTLNDRC